MEKNKNLMLAIVLFVMWGTACSEKKNAAAYWENAPVVAEKTVVNGDEVITLDPDLLKDTIVFPVSHFMEEIEIVKLDDKDEALIGQSSITLSENYILVKNGDQIPCKLFGKKGNFIGNVGSIGQGPGEYRDIYSMQIDEASKRIYLLPWFGDNLLVYDLNCQPLPPVKLPYRANKGVFKVVGDKVTVAVLPFPGIPLIAWVQTLGGEALHEIPAGKHLAVPDFNNEISSAQNTPAMDLSFWFWPTRVDSMYHIDTEKGTLIPQFTVKFDEENMEPHSYSELPDYFMGDTKSIHYEFVNGQNRTVGTKTEFYIVDKQTLKGAFFRVENDYWGGMEEWPLFLFNKGYFVRNMDPGNAEEWIEKALKYEGLSESLRKKLTGIQQTISPNDNNYVLYAKMKQ